MKYFKNSDDTSSLRNEAIGYGACQEGLDDWTKDKDGLCERYYRYADFCIAHDFPTVEYLKQHFDGIAQKHGIFVDGTFEVTNFKYLSPVGKSVGSAEYNNYGVGCIYLRHSARLELTVLDQAIVRVYLYDNATLHITNTSSRPVYVYRYGGEVCAKGYVIVRNRLSSCICT